MHYNGLVYSRKLLHLLTNDGRIKDSLFDAEMFWLTDWDVLFKGIADEKPTLLADVEITETIVDEERAVLWDCNALELTDTPWLRLALALWDAGSDLLEYGDPVAVTDREAFTDALSKNTLELSVCETFLDALAFWIETEKTVVASRVWDYLDTCKRPEFDSTVLLPHKIHSGVFFFTIGRTFQDMK